MEAQLGVMRDREEQAEALKDLKAWAVKQKAKDHNASTRAMESKRRGSSSESSARHPDLAEKTSTGNQTGAGALHAQKEARLSDRGTGVVASDSQKVESSGGILKSSQAPNSSAAQSSTGDGGSAADKARNDGNTAYRRGDWAAAEVAYSRSIDLSPSAAAFANRAQVHLKRRAFGAAEADSSRALELDPCFTKAWHRRGAARKALDQLLDAATDFEEALRLDPTNRSLQAEREACIEAWKASNPTTGPARVEVAVKRGSSEAERRKALDAACREAEHASEKSGGRAGGAVDAELLAASLTARQGDGMGSPALHEMKHNEPIASAHSYMHAHAHQSARGGAEKVAVSTSDPQGGSSHWDSDSDVPGASGGFCDMKVQAVDESQERAWKSEGGLLAGVRRPSGGDTVPAVDCAVAEKLQALGIASSNWNGKARNGDSKLTGSCKRELREPKPSPGQRWRPPKTGVEFETVWRGLKSRPEEQAAYLRLLEPSVMPALLKQALTGPLLASLVNAAMLNAERGDAKGCIEVLEGLQRVPRFSMAAMSLSRSQRKALSERWPAVDSLDANLQSKSSAMRSAYGL